MKSFLATLIFSLGTLMAQADDVKQFDLGTIRPKGAVFDIYYANGKVYVPDLSNNMVIILNDQLEKIHVINDVLSPHAAVADKDGNMYVGQHRSHGIRKFSADFQEVAHWDADLRSQTQAPMAFEFGLTGNLYVCDWLLQRVIEITPNGKFVRAFEDGPIKAKAEFQAHGIAVDGKNKRVYIADRGNEGGSGAIHAFTLEGKYLSSWAKPTADFDPFTVRRLAEGLYMVPNYTDGQLYIFNPEGQLLEKMDLLGDTPGKFQKMTSIAADRQGFIYGSELGGNRIQKVDMREIINRLQKK